MNGVIIPKVKARTNKFCFIGISVRVVENVNPSALTRLKNAIFAVNAHFIVPETQEKFMVSEYAHDVNQKYKRHAIERFIRPEEIAELAFYLMSDYGEIVCGHTVVADGGDNNATL